MHETVLSVCGRHILVVVGECGARLAWIDLRLELHKCDGGQGKLKKSVLCGREKAAVLK